MEEIGIDFSIVEGDGATLPTEPQDTNDQGEACVDLDATAEGTVTVRAETTDSGLSENVTVGVVDSFSSVFGSSTSRIDPKMHYDEAEDLYTADGGTTFEAIFVNGSNREFDIRVGSVVFCKKDLDGESAPISISADIAGGSRVSGGGEILVSVTTENEHDGTGFAVALNLHDDPIEPFAVTHQFKEDAVICDPS